MSKEILRKYWITAKKSFWQNFLVNEKILETIISRADIFEKNIIEVGPGYGALTEYILKEAPQNLDLVELDRDMISILQQRLENKDFHIASTQMNIHNIDVLEFFPSFSQYQVIANIPYYITSPIIRHFLYEGENSPESMMILMQKEVADKIMKGQKWYSKKLKTSFLSLLISKKCRVEEVIFVPKSDFIPAPKVDSQVLRFEKITDYDFIDDKKFLDFLQLAFCEPRKKLRKNLEKWGFEKEKIQAIFTKFSIHENTRAEQLDIASYCNIIADIHNILT